MDHLKMVPQSSFSLFNISPVLRILINSFSFISAQNEIENESSTIYSKIVLGTKET